MAMIDLWYRISSAGVQPGMEDHFRRKIELSNRISVLAGIVIFAWSVVFRVVLGADFRMVLVMLAAVAGYCWVPVLNRARHYSLSRGLLTFLPPTAIIACGGVISDTPVTAFKFGLLSTILVPLLVFGVTEPRKMLLGIAWVAAAFPGMDALMPMIPTPAGLDARQLDGPLSLTINAWLSCVMFAISFMYSQRLNITAEQNLEVEKAKADRLLLNVLPREIAAILKESDRTIAEHLTGTSILFADIVGFTPLSAQLSAGAVVDLLNELFSEFDRLAEALGVEKIKTIGDCYMAATGVPRPSSEHAQSLARLALAMQEHIRCYTFQGRSLTLRIGINSGPVTAGVIGRKKFIYDLWGDTVNIASRMESHGRGGVIQITDATHALIKDDFVCASGGLVDVKGKGEMHVWHVLGARTRGAPDVS